MPEIHLGLIDKAYVSKEETNGGRHLLFEVWLPPADRAIDYELKPSPHFWLKKMDELDAKGRARIAYDHTPLVTPSAGSISFFLKNRKLQAVAMAQKDNQAPRDPGFFVPRNGFPQSARDWETMDHLVRETWEEGIMLTRDYELILPRDEPDWEKCIYERAAMLVTRTNLAIDNEKRCAMYLVDGPDIINVHKKGKKKPVLSVSGYISWTPETGFNVIKPLYIHRDPEQALLADGETLPDGKPLMRPYGVFNAKDLGDKRFGDVIQGRMHKRIKGRIYTAPLTTEFLTDKVPRSVLCGINGPDGRPLYPIDWIEESRAFLSRPEIQQQPSKVPYSTLEKQLAGRA